MEGKQEVSTMIEEYRQRRGLTLEKLGEKLGVHWGTVWRWEHGRRTPPAEVIRLALVGLDVEQGWKDAGTEGEGDT